MFYFGYRSVIGLWTFKKIRTIYTSNWH